MILKHVHYILDKYIRSFFRVTPKYRIIILLRIYKVLWFKSIFSTLITSKVTTYQRNS